MNFINEFIKNYKMDIWQKFNDTVSKYQKQERLDKLNVTKNKKDKFERELMREVFNNITSCIEKNMVIPDNGMNITKCYNNGYRHQIYEVYDKVVLKVPDVELKIYAKNFHTCMGIKIVGRGSFPNELSKLFDLG